MLIKYNELYVDIRNIHPLFFFFYFHRITPLLWCDQVGFNILGRKGTFMKK